MYFASDGQVVHWASNFWQSDFRLWEGLVIPPAWTLGLELNFYLVAPFLLRLRSMQLFAVSCLVLVAKFAAIKLLHLWDPWTYRFFPFEIGYFLLGALAFRYRHSFTKIPAGRAKYCLYVIVIILTAWEMPIKGAMFVYPILFVFLLPSLFAFTADLKADRLIGELSYPFYIFHYFCIDVARTMLASSEDDPGAAVVWIALALTLMLSVIALFLEHRLVEPWRTRLAD